MKKVESVLVTKYGVGVVAASWTTVEWAVAEVARTFGLDVAAREMRAVNRIRQRHGKYNTIPDYGTPLFAAYFAK